MVHRVYICAVPNDYMSILTNRPYNNYIIISYNDNGAQLLNHWHGKQATT